MKKNVFLIIVAIATVIMGYFFCQSFFFSKGKEWQDFLIIPLSFCLAYLCQQWENAIVRQEKK